MSIARRLLLLAAVTITPSLLPAAFPRRLTILVGRWFSSPPFSI